MYLGSISHWRRRHLPDRNRNGSKTGWQGRLHAAIRWPAFSISSRRLKLVNLNQYLLRLTQGVVRPLIHPSPICCSWIRRRKPIFLPRPLGPSLCGNELHLEEVASKPRAGFPIKIVDDKGRYRSLPGNGKQGWASKKDSSSDRDARRGQIRL